MWAGSNLSHAMRQKVRLIVTAILIMFAISVTPANAAKPLPPEVQALINEDIKSCDGKVKFEKGFLTRRDINGDGVEDLILDYNNFICGENSYADCGNAGCLMVVFASLPDGTFVNVLSERVQGIEFKTVRGRPAMLLGYHGTACGRSGAEPCSSTLYWNGVTFSPAN